jgi:hypothetical protein
MVKRTSVQPSLKNLAFTYPESISETLLGTPETLPTSEPSTPQVSYTVQQSDLPTMSLQPFSLKWIGAVFGGGKFVTAGNVYWRMKKNGDSVATGNDAVSANNYYTLSAYFRDVVVGDVLELAIWSNQSDSTFDYHAGTHVHPTRLVPHARWTFYKELSMAAVLDYPTLTSGNPQNSDELYTWQVYNDEQDNVIVSFAGPFSRKGIYIRGAQATYGLGRARIGDSTTANAAYFLQHASYRPYYRRGYILSWVKWRYLLID